MDIAERTALESNCVKYKTGAVIVRDNRIVLQGYNGTISGFENCSDKFHDCDMSVVSNRETHRNWSNTFEIHAEMNVISYAAKKGISLENTIMYCTHKPCGNCLKHIIQAGIIKVIFKHEFQGSTGLNNKDTFELIKYLKFEKYTV